MKFIKILQMIFYLLGHTNMINIINSIKKLIMKKSKKDTVSFKII